MSVVRTDLGDTRERARELRFETSAAIPRNNVQTAIEYVQANPPPSPAVTPTSVTVTPYNVLPTDRILYVNVAGPATINLPATAVRGGYDLMVKDVSGAAAPAPGNAISIVPNAADTGGIDGLNPYEIVNPYGAVTLYPSTLVWRTGS